MVGLRAYISIALPVGQVAVTFSDVAVSVDEKQESEDFVLVLQPTD